MARKSAEKLDISEGLNPAALAAIGDVAVRIREQSPPLPPEDLSITAIRDLAGDALAAHGETKPASVVLSKVSLAARLEVINSNNQSGE